MTASDKKNEESSIPGILVTVGIISILASPCVLGYQCLEWLKIGEWQPIPLTDVFLHYQIPYPTSDWGGVQKIMDWLMDCSLSGWLFFGGSFLTTIGVQVMEARK